LHLWHGGSAKAILAPYSCLLLLKNKNRTVKDQSDALIPASLSHLTLMVMENQLFSGVIRVRFINPEYIGTFAMQCTLSDQIIDRATG
jgi:hypothetical protein